MLGRKRGIHKEEEHMYIRTCLVYGGKENDPWLFYSSPMRVIDILFNTVFMSARAHLANSGGSGGKPVFSKVGLKVDLQLAQLHF